MLMQCLKCVLTRCELFYTFVCIFNIIHSGNRRLCDSKHFNWNIQNVQINAKCFRMNLTKTFHALSHTNVSTPVHHRFKLVTKYA